MATNVAQPRVKDIMSKEVIAVDAGDTLHEALELIVENRVSALPVVNGRGRCIGILSTSDLVDLTHELDDELHNIGRSSQSKQAWLIEQLSTALGSERVADHMSEEIAVIAEDVSLPEAAAAMLRNRVHRLPVVDDKQKLLGIVSTMDIMRVVADGVA